MVSLVLAITTWFAGYPRWLPAWVPAVAFVAAAVARFGPPRRLAPPAPETWLCLVLAVLYRLPALLHPWGWVNRDGAYGAFVTLHILQGQRPAPVFTEGANYQGTLKSHLAALLSVLTPASDPSLLMVAASLVLYLIFMAAAMALARRIGGRAAAAIAGLYLALGSRFLTVFSLNCVGQYVDVLALGGCALTLLARLLPANPPTPHEARPPLILMGLLLGAAFWQQPVALAYAVVVFLVLVLHPGRPRDGSLLWTALGLGLGVLPVILWNAQNDWASSDILGRDPSQLRSQVDALGHLVRRTVLISLPILAGVTPGHPWIDSEGMGRLAWLVPLAKAFAIAIFPVTLVGYLAVTGREALRSLKARRPAPALIPLLLVAANLVLFWAVASGRVYWRPRYLLPLTASLAVMLGVLLAAVGRRSRALAGGLLVMLLAMNVAGTWPRLRSSRDVAEPYERLVRSLQQKGVRTGYSDFSLSAPVTMFTREGIVLSSRLGPTPAYESERHARKVAMEGPDAYVLTRDDDPEQFAAVLRGLGVGYRLDIDPVPIFHGLSRRVRIEEVAGFRAGSRDETRGEVEE